MLVTSHTHTHTLSQKEVAHEQEENKAEQERLQGFNLVYGEKIQVSDSIV